MVFVYSRTVVVSVEKNDEHFRFHVTPGFLFAARTRDVTLGIDLRGVLSPIDASKKWAPGAFATVGVAF